MTLPARAARLRDPALRGAHLFVASGFAVAQPLLDVLSKNAEFFAVRGSTPGDIVLFALVVTFAPAIVLLAVELLAGLVDRRAGLLLHLFFVGALVATFAIQALERLDVASTATLIAGAVLAGVAAAFGAWRARFFRTFLAVLAPAPLVFLALFLVDSPVRELVFPADVDVALANVRTDTPVVMVVFDELPIVSLMDGEGRVDAHRYPNFARLAADSTWFRNTTTLSSSTTVAVPSILTGNTPKHGRLPVFQDYPDNLFTLVGGHYSLDVTESQTRLCPAELCERERPSARTRLSGLYSDARVVYLHLVAPPRLEDRLPPIDEAWTNFGAEQPAGLEGVTTSVPSRGGRSFYVGRVRDFRDFVRGIEPDRDEAPTFHFLHTLLPHGPWLYFPSGRASAVAVPSAPGRHAERWLNDALTLQAHQRHLLQLGFTDRLLGELIVRLKREGLYDRALVVVTADHGISFRTGDDRRSPTPTNLPDLAFVPLFVKLPGEASGRVVDRHVRTLDILPTVADALGIRVPWRIDGRSALAATTAAEGDEVRVGNVATSFASALAARDEALERQVATFGTGDWHQVFTAGRYGGLVGRRVESLRVLGEAGGEAVVDATGSRRLRSLREPVRAVPSPLVGKLSGVADGTALALAINGRVASLTEAYDIGGGVHFSALAPDSAFAGGENDIRLFVVDGPAAHPDFHELRTSLS